MFVELPSSPLAPGLTSVRIHYRETGHGFPLVFLHGGWGYEVYRFDAQSRALSSDFRILIPDRSGYGRSPRLERFARPLHPAGARETLSFLDALEIDRAVLWGHSDGAVMAGNAALEAPDRIAALILEATHLDRKKPHSREFFSGLATDPESVGPRVAARLQEEHGDPYWKQMLAMEGEVWMEILDGADAPEGDLFEGRLSKISVPTLVLHGEVDPRTEPGELELLRALLPEARFHVIPGAGHSPHSERAYAFECTRVALDFLRGVAE